MRVFLVLFRRELKALFLSPIAWVVLALVMSLHAFSFRTSMTVLTKEASAGNIVQWTFDSPWFLLSYFFIFPLLTMRLFAEEKKTGTMETLFTAPVTSWQVVLAKYGSVVLFYILLWVPTLANFMIFRWVGGASATLPMGSLAGAYMILLASGLFYLAVGLWASSLTHNQIIAAVLSFTVTLGHFMLLTYALPIGVQIVGSSATPLFTRIARHFASFDTSTFVSGLIDTRPIVYYSSLALFFLFLTWHALEFRRWKL
jgi:ABC-2 type transport system permease protein